jgi:catechol 2,3-dioxygenase-like lactoylglutathione lyase family enzyme
MSDFYARAVFFVKDAERALTFYRDQLGFSLDWRSPAEGRVWVFQMSLMGFELILNNVESEKDDRAGHGRVFIGLEDDQIPPLRKHLEDRGIETTLVDWGQITTVIRDLDGNEVYFWMQGSDKRVELDVARPES